MGTTFMDFFSTGEVAFGGEGHMMKPYMTSFILICFFSSGVAAKGSDVVQVKPGDDVTLPCSAGDGSIRAVEWTRPDLESEYVLFYRDGRSDPTQQHSTFRGRVQLMDGEPKDRNVSLVLKNVNSNDSGTYECRVSLEVLSRSMRVKKSLIETDPIASVRLEVANSRSRNIVVGSHTRFDVVKVEPRDNVTLECLAGEGLIKALEWTRTDLKTEYVLFYMNGQLEPTQQHSTFQGRAQLVDGELKDRNVSLLLKNVNVDDSGTYECRVLFRGPTQVKKTLIDNDPIASVRLEVADSASGPKSVEVGTLTRIGLALGFIVLWPCLAGLAVSWKMRRTPEQPARGSGSDQIL
ncbi:carcinoembryonic antigen-related cell adhesion molecule 1-like [Morone saxatilis]|uniref:carcinoembryonic antigen-related cell adhesion molecule 1-like n=1 Tax=Morone saxatilis TaxID=34816 RepID=UPI0015E1CA4B|nr:carcinoembryonic antigen-related cell adhesion molecule 1-like [Morone saxatilis]